MHLFVCNPLLKCKYLYDKLGYLDLQRNLTFKNLYKW